MIETIISCDICKKKSTEVDEIHHLHNTKSLQVIFTTEQTEGKSCRPYLYKVDIDICDNCLQKVLQGNYVYANGAMGHNTYYFKEK